MSEMHCIVSAIHWCKDNRDAIEKWKRDIQDKLLKEEEFDEEWQDAWGTIEILNTPLPIGINYHDISERYGIEIDLIDFTEGIQKGISSDEIEKALRDIRDWIYHLTFELQTYQWYDGTDRP